MSSLQQMTATPPALPNANDHHRAYLATFRSLKILMITTELIRLKITDFPTKIANSSKITLLRIVRISNPLFWVNSVPGER